ncbi:MAG: hypothetical protein AAFQ43_01990, partial [Bacteroidota bacterium]
TISALGRPTHQPRSLMRFATPLFALLLVLVAGGCASAEGAYDDAFEAELAGDLPTAFDRYYTALRRDDEIADARTRLAGVGERLIAGFLAEASGATPMRAADLYLSVEQHVGRAAEVGVALETPPTFDADRDRTFALAVDDRMAAARAARGAGAFSEALDALNDARDYRPTAREGESLDAEARSLYFDWSRDDLARGRFRRAYSSAASGLALSPPGSEMALSLGSLQREILDLGSVRVAFFPVERDGPGGSDGRRSSVGGSPRMPIGFADDLDDVLNDDHWRTPPLFVLSADPADVRRLVRRERDAEDLVNREGYLGTLARDLDADFGAAFSVGRWRETVEERDRDVRQATLRRGGSATYDRVRQRLTLSATVTFSLVDARTRRVLCESDIRREARETLTVHEYDGDWRDLALDRNERRYFTDDNREEVETELHIELIESLAQAVADNVYRCAGRVVS